MVNEGLQVFDKVTGTSQLGPVAISSIWSGFGGACQTGGNGDPIVVYDQLADRWIISQFATPSGATVPQDECIAISQTGDATGAWYRYDFHLTSNFLDYPKLGVWPDGYYMSANVFNTAGTSFLGPQAFVFDRVKTLTGDSTATSQTRGITGGSSEAPFLPSDLDGIIPPAVGDPNHFVSFPQGSPLIYKIRAYHVDFTNPANSTFTLEASVGAASFTSLCPTTRNCVPQAGTTSGLDEIGDRLMFRNAYRRFSDGHESLLNNYTVSANAVAGIRWFELQRTQPGNWGIFQQSTYQPDTTWRWMGSIASDNQDNIALGFSASSGSINPQIRYAGRLATDPLNTLSGEQHLFDGTGSQSATSNRWGDYSDLTVDPVDDCTFYYTNEYYPTTSSFNWRTRIGYFKFAECTAPQKGTAHFIVTACSGGAAVSNASVSIDGTPYGATLSDGTYDTLISPGSHSYTVSKTGVGTQSGNF
ncbi:MAG: PKD domain-containing protein, partial [Verrucomicrobia bacterium]